jgi:FkbM family methyltransferase
MTVIETAGLKFLCETELEGWRAQTLLTKEPGTLAWLNAELREGDVFYDIGANIGAYTLYAARLVGPTGKVYAFEPHVMNAAGLMRNIAANGFTDRVEVFTLALGAVRGLQSFHYQSVVAGSSGSQLGHTISEDGRAFQPALTEYKAVQDLSSLLDDYHRHVPQLVKIDVDGNELGILWGLQWWMRQHPKLIRSMQVEVRQSNRHGVNTWMREHGYVHSGDHFTSQGMRALEAGASPEILTHNAVFTRAA